MSKVAPRLIFWVFLMVSEQSNAQVERANLLTSTARSAWLAYLAIVVFLGITALGVTDEDFFGLNRTTTLPLVDIGVPTRIFFSVAPIIASASYSYLHVYLIRLFETLGSMNARHNGSRVGDILTPWIVADSALKLRQIFRRDGCVSSKPLDALLLGFNFVSVWLAGPVVIFLLWWASTTARDPFVSSVAFVGVLVSVGVGATSILVLWRSTAGQSGDRNQVSGIALPAFLVLITSAGVYASWERTAGNIDRLSNVDLSSGILASGSSDWVAHTQAREIFFADWCENVVADCTDVSKRSVAFQNAWKEKRDFDIGILRKSDLVGLNLSSVVFDQGFLPGLNFKDTNLERAAFGNAVVEQADFTNSTLIDAAFNSAEASHTDFQGATLQGASFVQAQLLGADFTFAYLPSVNFDRANLSTAQFAYAYIAGEPLTQTGNRIQSTLNSFAWGSQQNRGPTIELNISGTDFRYSAIRNYDLSEATFDKDTNLKDAFLDGSVGLPEDLVGSNAPCHWLKTPAQNDEEFFGRWRGFIESRSRGAFAPSWEMIAPEQWKDVASIGPDAC